MFDVETILERIQDESKSVESRAIVAFLFMTLCRPSEAFALTKHDDIDWHIGRIHFRKAMRRTDVGYAVLSGTKTGTRGERSPIIPTALLELLKQLHEKGSPSPYLFTNKAGLPLNNWRWRAHWQSVVKELELPDGIGAYSLKTLGNSFLLAQGQSPESNRALMGHTTTSTMVTDVYRVVLPQEEARRNLLFSEALRTICGANFPESRRKARRKTDQLGAQ
jgi:integrase